MAKAIMLLAVLFASLGCGSEEPDRPLEASSVAPDVQADARGWATDLARGLVGLGYPWTDTTPARRTHLSLLARDFLTPRTEGRATAVRVRLVRGGQETPIYAAWFGGSNIEGDCAIPAETIASLEHAEVTSQIGGQSDSAFSIVVDVYYGG